MESVYCVEFSSGHIKVGMSSIPKFRIGQHAERVSCIGVELVRSEVVDCEGDAEQAERSTLHECRKKATFVYKREWFAGLDFDDVVSLIRKNVKVAEKNRRKEKSS